MFKINFDEVNESDLNWIIAGIYFGFPECCIQQFLNFDPYSNFGHYFDGTGFVPCDRCKKQNHNFILKNINHYRFCSKTFPEGNLSLDGYNYIPEYNEFREFFIEHLEYNQ